MDGREAGRTVSPGKPRAGGARAHASGLWIHRSSKAEARWGLLSDWGATQLARRIGR